MGPLAQVRGLGLAVTVLNGDRLAVEPRILITDDARRLIREQRDDILRELRDEADLLALAERVAAHYRCPPDELVLVRRVALADPVAARECFEAVACLEGIPIDQPAPVVEEARKPGEHQ